MFHISAASSIALGKVLESSHDLTEFIIAFLDFTELHLQATHAYHKAIVLSRIPLTTEMDNCDTRVFYFQLSQFLDIWKQISTTDDVEVQITEKGWMVNGLLLIHHDDAFLSKEQRTKNDKLFEVTQSHGMDDVVCCVLLSTQLLITAILYVCFGNGECECMLRRIDDEKKLVFETKSQNGRIQTVLHNETIRDIISQQSVSLKMFVRFLRIFVPCLSLVPKIHMLTLTNGMCFGFQDTRQPTSVWLAMLGDVIRT